MRSRIVRWPVSPTPLAANFWRPRMRRWLRRLLAAVCCCALCSALQAETITVAAAADLKFAMDEIVAAFEAELSRRPWSRWSSARRASSRRRSSRARRSISTSPPTSSSPVALAEAGFAASGVRPYALGRIVLWSASLDATRMTLEALADPAITRIAIANPQHAPYGKRAEEALRASGLWEKVESKLVFGENIAQTAQFVETGNAQVGILALSLAKSPQLAKQGRLLAGAGFPPRAAGAGIHRHETSRERPAGPPLRRFHRFSGRPRGHDPLRLRAPRRSRRCRPLGTHSCSWRKAISSLSV